MPLLLSALWRWEAIRVGNSPRPRHNINFLFSWSCWGGNSGLTHAGQLLYYDLVSRTCTQEKTFSVCVLLLQRVLSCSSGWPGMHDAPAPAYHITGPQCATQLAIHTPFLWADPNRWNSQATQQYRKRADIISRSFLLQASKLMDWILIAWLKSTSIFLAYITIR